MFLVVIVGLHWGVQVASTSEDTPIPGLANRAENVSLLGVCATLAWSVEIDAVFSDPFGSCHLARVDDENACSSRSVMPFGWLRRHDGSAGALAKTGGSSCPAAADNSDD